MNSSNAGLKIANISQNGNKMEIIRQATAPASGGKRDRLAHYDGYFSISGGLCLNAGAVNVPTPTISSNTNTGLTTAKIIQKGNESTVMCHTARFSAHGNHYRSHLLLQVLCP